MKKAYLLISLSTVFIFLAFWLVNFNGSKPEDDANIILNKEKAALTKWANRDVWGYLNLFAEDATYFDPGTKMKLRGYESIKDYIAPWDGKVYSPSYEIINRDIRIIEKTGILTYNLYNFDEKGDTTALWNSTEIYQKIKGNWKIVHSHWSLVKRK